MLCILFANQCLLVHTFVYEATFLHYVNAADNMRQFSKHELLNFPWDLTATFNVFQASNHLTDAVLFCLFNFPQSIAHAKHYVMLFEIMPNNTSCT